MANQKLISLEQDERIEAAAARGVKIAFDWPGTDGPVAASHLLSAIGESWRPIAGPRGGK